MRKLVGLLVGLLMIFGVVGSASATPTTWTDEIEWNPAHKIDWFASYDYTHDITDGAGGFVGFASGGNDIVFDYTLTVDLHDDGGWFDSWEVAVIDQPGLVGDGTYNFSYANQTLGWSLAGLISLNLDGSLDISIDSYWGDFYLDSSTLVANGDNGDIGASAPVPEPTTMLLFGLGLLGLAGVSRKKQ